MTHPLPASGLQLQSRITSGGKLELSLTSAPLTAPAPDEVVVRMEASPINPSDIALLFGPADMRTARASGSAQRPAVIADIPAARLPTMTGRFDQSMPTGNEGAGVVIAAGPSDEAQALLGKTVALLGGGMYAQYRTINLRACLVLPAGATAADGASAFINPLTALGMVSTLRLEGHSALVHSAAASNLGQMLNKVCQADGIALVNIVRGPEAEKLLRALGAKYVCNSSAPDFLADLTEAVAATGATLGFDAIGGGKLAGQILACMEAAACRKLTAFSRYGSAVHKQVYTYGTLDAATTELNRAGYGMAWGVGGWLLTAFLARIGPVEAQKLRERVAAELKTTFASHYTREISLSEALQPDIMAAYYRRATGEKYLINPNKGLARD